MISIDFYNLNEINNKVDKENDQDNDSSLGSFFN